MEAHGVARVPQYTQFTAIGAPSRLLVKAIARDCWQVGAHGVMGQAKQRGDYEQRRALAAARQQQEQARRTTTTKPLSLRAAALITMVQTMGALYDLR